MTIPGTDLPAKGATNWFGPFTTAWNALRGKTKDHDDLLTTGRLSPEGLSSAIDAAVSVAVPKRRAVVATVGDSISAAAGSYLNAGARLGPAMAGDHLDYWHVFATGGFTLDQIAATHIPAAIAATPKPTHIALFGGTNDLDNSKTFAQVKASHDAALSLILAAGCTPILWAPPPRSAISGNATSNAITARWAHYIRQLGLQRGWEVVDAHTLLQDVATGGLAAAYNNAPTPNTAGDGVHPNYAGHIVIARAYATVLRRIFPVTAPAALASLFDPALTAGIGLFLTDTNADGIADGASSVSAGATAAVVSGAPVGNFQRKTVAAGSTSPGSIRWAHTGIVAGRTYEIAYVFKAKLLPTDDATGAIAMSWRTDSASIAPMDPGGGQHGANGVRGLADTDLVWVRFTAVAPATATQIRTDLSITGTSSVDGWAQIGMLAIRDLTALGIA